MPACGSCAALDAPSVCGGCHFAAYCGPACQRTAWAGHKAVCKAIQADAAASPDGRDAPRAGARLRRWPWQQRSASGRLDGRKVGCKRGGARSAASRTA